MAELALSITSDGRVLLSSQQQAQLINEALLGAGASATTLAQQDTIFVADTQSSAGPIEPYGMIDSSWTWRQALPYLNVPGDIFFDLNSNIPLSSQTGLPVTIPTQIALPTPLIPVVGVPTIAPPPQFTLPDTILNFVGGLLGRIVMNLTPSNQPGPLGIIQLGSSELPIIRMN